MYDYLIILIIKIVCMCLFFNIIYLCKYHLHKLTTYGCIFFYINVMKYIVTLLCHTLYVILMLLVNINTPFVSENMFY